MMYPKPKKSSRKKLIKVKSLMAKADAVFSKFIRNRDEWKCVLCGSTANVQCGHLIKRGKKSVRFDETNCHALCSRCNYKDNFEHDLYVDWFIREYGAGPYLDLVDRSKRMKKMDRQHLLEVIQKYEQLTKKMEKI